MTMPRRSGPSPAVVLFGATAVALILVLAVLAIRGDVVGQLRNVWGSFFPPAAVTDQGTETRNLYDIVFALAVIVFLVVEGLIVFAILRYRRKPTDEALPPQVHGNNLLEVVWTIVPTAIVAFLFIVSWQTLNSVDAVTSAPDVRIRAVASRFQWTFEYLDQSGQQVTYQQLTPELVVPAGETVHLTLYSPDVIHAFYVPQFLFKRDVVPGKDNNFDFRIDQQYAGQTFRGQCAELCGTGHWIMQFTVKAMTPDDYQAWLKQQIASVPPSQSPGASGPAASGPAASGPAASGPAASGQSAGTLDITAKNIAYQENNLEAPANQPFTIHFDNQDAGVPHNVSIHKDSPSGEEVFKGAIFSGVAAQDYSVPALPAGTYSFVCSVHPNMTGTLTVK